MLLIVGSKFDPQPAKLLERSTHFALRAEIITPADLSRSGWRLRSGPDIELSAGLKRGPIPGGEITAVVNLLPWVTVHELPHILAEDRHYVANEIGAFMLAWLYHLECPVIDRPSPLSLSGCGRWPEEWMALAASIDLLTDFGWSGSQMEITVLNGRCIGAWSGVTGEVRAAERLAIAASRSLVTFAFAQDQDRPRLTGVFPRPSVGSPEVADALLGWLISP